MTWTKFYLTRLTPPNPYRNIILDLFEWNHLFRGPTNHLNIISASGAGQPTRCWSRFWVASMTRLVFWRPPRGQPEHLTSHLVSRQSWLVTPEKIDKSPMPNPDVFHPKVSASASSSSAAPAASSAEVGLASPVSKSPKEIKHKEKDKSKKTEKTEKVKHKDKSAKASKKPKEADGLKVKKADKLKKWTDHCLQQECQKLHQLSVSLAASSAEGSGKW